jgi:predicted nucleic acid-binding protein
VIHFLDTSALTKRYAEEMGSPAVRALFRRRARIAVSRIAYAEISAAVARKERDGDLRPNQADAVLGRLGRDFSALLVVEVKAPVVERVPGIVRRHPLRGYDAVQLACALALREARASVTFWCADVELERAAIAEGLRTHYPK